MNHEFRSTPSGEKSIKGIPQRRVGAESDLDGAIMLRASSASRYRQRGEGGRGILADVTINSIRARIVLHVIASQRVARMRAR